MPKLGITLWAQEMAAGEQRSAIAYHGVPLHFKFRCTATSAPEHKRRLILELLSLSLGEVCQRIRSRHSAADNVQAGPCVVAAGLFLLLASHASAWPRDASSLRHLSLLAWSSRLKLTPRQAMAERIHALPSLQVRRGDYPTTNAHEHINANP